MNEAMTYVLKDCAHCGRLVNRQTNPALGVGDEWSVTCDGCGASVPGDDSLAAISNWNRRSPPAAAQQTIPEGWVAVPKQWTSSMAHAGYMVHQNDKIACAECGDIYRAMIAAAPKLEK